LHFSGAALPLGATVTFGGKVPTTGTPTPSSVGTSIKNNWKATGGIFEPSGLWAATVTWVDILVKFGPFEDGPSAVTPVGGAIGAGGGDAVPPSVTLLVQKLTTIGGHVGRGRMFMPGLLEAVVDVGGLVSSGAVTSLQANFNKTLTDMDTGLIPMYLLHNFDPDDDEDTPRDPTKVTSLVVQSRIATQRHRNRR
jgi:hypothetical protein